MTTLRILLKGLLISLLFTIEPTFAQFYYADNGNGTCTIQGYYGTNSTVNIPGSTNGLIVTSIQDNAFLNNTIVTSVTIPNSVTSIGNTVFWGCTSLTNVTIPNSVTYLGAETFIYCYNLISVTIPSSVTNDLTAPFEGCTSLSTIPLDPANPFYTVVDGVLFDKNQTTLVEFPGGKGGSYTIPSIVTNFGDYAFASCQLTNVTIPNSVISVGNWAFYESALTYAFFQGNEPAETFDNAFYYTESAVYYLPGTTGWGSSFGAVPTTLWNPQATSLSTAGGLLGFNITGTAGIPIVVEACTNLGSTWLPLQTCTVTNGSIYFSDPQWTNYPSRFYRISSP
jgi:hypothetical protein